jgi:heat shock protein 1/8
LVDSLKKDLSINLDAELDLRTVLGKSPLSSIIMDRKHFQEMSRDLFEKVFIPIEQVLRDAHISKDQVNEVVFMGGSTAMPKMREMLSDFFKSGSLTNGNKRARKCVHKHLSNDQTIVARGAAIQAAILTQADEKEEATTSTTIQKMIPLKDTLLLDVIPITLGLETAGGVMTPLVLRNLTVPAEHTRYFVLDLPHSWSSEGRDTRKISLRIFEGENGLTKENNLLDELPLTITLPAQTEPSSSLPQIKIEVSFRLDANSILTVSARQIERTTETEPLLELHKTEVKIQYGKRRDVSNEEELRKVDRELSSSLMPVYYRPLSNIVQPSPM